MRFRPLPKQRGALLPLIVLVVGGALIAVIAGTMVLNTKQLANSFAADREAYMDDVRNRLELWYGRNLNVEADPAYSLGSDQLLQEAGVRRQYGINLVMSPQLTDGTVKYHKIAIVAPGALQGAASGGGWGAYSTDGTFSVSPGFFVKEFDGRARQQRAVYDTTKALQTLATILEMRVNAKIQVDATREGDTNFFRPRLDCYHVNDDEFPCTGGFVAIGDYLANLPALGQVTGIPVKSAWGTDIQLSNELDVNPTAAPFTATLQAATPWGSEITVKAVQPIY